MNTVAALITLLLTYGAYPHPCVVGEIPKCHSPESIACHSPLCVGEPTDTITIGGKTFKATDLVPLDALGHGSINLYK